MIAKMASSFIVMQIKFCRHKDSKLCHVTFTVLLDANSDSTEINASE